MDFDSSSLQFDWLDHMFILNRLNTQICPQRFAENANKPSTFYCININLQCIIFLKLKPKTFKKYKIMSIY